jgi:N-acetyl-anhydromuramyl-L-alanine amidase AmpD
MRYNALILFLLFSVCLSAQVINRKVSTGFRIAENRKIDVLIIHSVYNNTGGDLYDVQKILNLFKRYKVSAHYLIGRAGEVYRLVDDKNVAYHAGKSVLPDGRTAVNSCSLGIELMNSTTDSITTLQQDALIQLTKSLHNNYRFKYILRHSDIAPGRKTDPWNLNWDNFLNLIK